MTRTPAAAANLEAGWEALERGDWSSARSIFAPPAAREPTPDALEGLGWAAWWLEDGGAVFAAREHACRLFRDAADARGAGRVVTWLALDYRCPSRGSWCHGRLLS